MEGLFLRVVGLSLACSALLLPLLLCAGRLQSRYTAHTLYFVWLLLALRLVLPIQLPAARPAVMLEAPAYQVELSRIPRQAAEPLTEPVEGADTAAPREHTAPPSAPAARTVSVTAILAWVWLCAAVCLPLAQGTVYLLARASLLRRAVPADGAWEETLERVRGELGVKRSLPVRVTGEVRSPMVLGLFRPVLLLPARPFAAGEREVMLRHELYHLKRHDVAYKLLLLAAADLHWFNPLVWWMYRAAGQNLELCCDEQVVAGRSPAYRRAYGEVLLRTTERRTGPAAATRFGSSRRQMGERLKNLFARKKKCVPLVAVVLLAAMMAGGLVACRSGRARVTEEEAMDRLTSSITWDRERGSISFVIPDVETPSQPWRLHIAGRSEREGLGGVSTHYMDTTDWQPGEAYEFTLEDPVEDITELSMEITLGKKSRTVDLLSFLLGDTLYVSETYGFTLRLPESWAGAYEAEENGYTVDIYQKAAKQADDPTAGYLMSVCVTTRAAFDEVYGDKDLDGMYAAAGLRITVLGMAGERLVYLHIDPLPEDLSGLDEAYVRMHREAEAITAGAFAARDVS